VGVSEESSKPKINSRPGDLRPVSKNARRLSPARQKFIVPVGVDRRFPGSRRRHKRAG
jgi:hypothetical protein